MATKKAAKKAAKKKTTRKKKKQDQLTDDPPILVGGGGSTLTSETYIKLPAGTPKVATVGVYDIYRVAWDVGQIITKEKRTGGEKKSKPENNTWNTVFEPES